MKKLGVVYICVSLFIVVGIIFVSSLNLDINRDGVINMTDLQILASHFQGKSAYNSTFDLNNNGKVDLFDIVSVAKRVNLSSGSGGSGNSSGAPVAPEVGSSNIVFDTRAGGIEDIQSPNVTTFADALAATKPFGYKNTSSGGYPVYPLDFVTNFDGNGTHAFRFNWKYLGGYTGDPSTCYNGNGEQNVFVYFNRNVPLDAGGVYIQWKMWRGRTETGGGYGNSTVGSWEGSGKIMIIFRTSDASHRLYFGMNMGGTGFQADIGGNPQWDQVRGATYGTFTGYLNTNAININDYKNQIQTYTYWIKPESSAGAGDGEIKTWFNGILLWDFTNAPTGVSNLGEQQFGGPTWICPPQDQTHYEWDWVEWTA